MSITEARKSIHWFGTLCYNRGLGHTIIPISGNFSNWDGMYIIRPSPDVQIIYDVHVFTPTKEICRGTIKIIPNDTDTIDQGGMSPEISEWLDSLGKWSYSE
jgi:hypothetical protein